MRCSFLLICSLWFCLPFLDKRGERSKSSTFFIGGSEGEEEPQLRCRHCEGQAGRADGDEERPTRSASLSIDSICLVLALALAISPSLSYISFMDYPRQTVFSLFIVFFLYVFSLLLIALILFDFVLFTGVAEAVAASGIRGNRLIVCLFDCFFLCFRCSTSSRFCLFSVG